MSSWMRRRSSPLSSVGIKLFSVAPILAFRFIPAVLVLRFAVQISNFQQKWGQQPGGRPANATLKVIVSISSSGNFVSSIRLALPFSHLLDTPPQPNQEK